MKDEAQAARLTASVVIVLMLAACMASAPAPITPTIVPEIPTAVVFPTVLPTNTPQPTPTITPTPTPEMIQLTTDGCCVMPSWSPDSKQVVFIDRPGPQVETGVYALDIHDQSAGPQLAGRVGIYSPRIRKIHAPSSRNSAAANAGSFPTTDKR